MGQERRSVASAGAKAGVVERNGVGRTSVLLQASALSLWWPALTDVREDFELDLEMGSELNQAASQHLATHRQGRAMPKDWR